MRIVRRIAALGSMQYDSIRANLRFFTLVYYASAPLCIAKILGDLVRIESPEL
jgi:hypothetical protein